MTAQAKPHAPRSDTRLAIACVLFWLAGAGLSHLLGIWVGMGGTALLLALSVAILDGRALPGRLVATPRTVALGVLAGGLMSAATYALYPVVRSLAPGIEPQAAALYRAFRAAPGWEVALLLPLVVAGEELVWRGVVLPAAIRRWGALRGVILGAALYALAHGPIGSPLLVIVALCCGLYWGALLAWTQSLAAALVAHLVWDVMVLVIKPVL